MAQFWWDPSMGDPLIPDNGTTTAVLEEDNLGELCLSFRTTANGDMFNARWPGSEDSNAVDVFCEYRASHNYNFRWFGVHIKLSPLGHVSFRKVSPTSFSLEVGSTINNYVQVANTTGALMTTRTRHRGRFNTSETLTLKAKEWLPTDPEPELWGLEADDTTYTDAGRPGLWLRLTNGTYRIFLYAFGWGTDGDPAPTGPVGGAPKRSPLIWTPY